VTILVKQQQNAAMMMKEIKLQFLIFEIGVNLNAYLYFPLNQACFSETPSDIDGHSSFPISHAYDAAYSW
jgi:hypothetical protein